ncbi:hypothetical protein BBP00_00004492 [Phytophthora kernoviae]|uniref:Uncharacterized protein n=1 Tax=Phytophthora kernoviae TaxID=325452 RepID=A0A3F2RRJ6_9STRA|nr:hypothetical protein BBP00_00004492 [Phytophthora kernoviae]
MTRNSNLEKNDQSAYMDLEAHESASHLQHMTPVQNVPYMVKSQFAKEMMAEFVATFVTMLFGLSCMTQVVLSSEANGNFVTIALCWGLAFFFGITVGGGVSGAHLNPSVTTTLALLKLLPWKKVPFYILNQVIAAYVAALVVYILYRPMFNEVDPDRMTTHTIFATYPHENVGNFTCFLTEFVATALLILGILALLDQHNRPIGKKAVPPAVGALVSTIAMGFAMNTGLAINPARDLGPRLFMLCAGWGSRVFSLNHYYFWVPIVAPITGGAFGALVDFVMSHGVEFYPLGGDPKVLAAYMVKTGGHLIPTKIETLTKDVPRNKEMINEIVHSTWPAVSAADPDGGGPGVPGVPFQAQAIIANPVSYGHIHVAERLGVPLHIMFPQPWVPTMAFPHPLANMPYTDELKKSNYLSYKVVDLLMWQGTEGIINEFRTKVLKLRKIRNGDGGRDLLLDLNIPHAFMWSPQLVPKPADWGDLYDVIGTITLSGGPDSSYTPSPELEAFLGTDGGPIFVGFGSMMLADPLATTKIIIDAATQANVRVLVQSSWSDMAGDLDIPDNIFFLGNCPHDWLMPRVSAVVHHGGAGTTAAGLLAGKPTFIVPFFGDQPFWGHAVVTAGVGVEPCPLAQLTTEKLRAAFVKLTSPILRARSLELQEVMRREDGASEAVRVFYRHLPTQAMWCDLDHERIATRWSPRDRLKFIAQCQAFSTYQRDKAARLLRANGNLPVPAMNISLAAIGTWDNGVKQFVAVGMKLVAHGHRVRLAANECFRAKIIARGLEFYPLANAPDSIQDFARLLYNAQSAALDAEPGHSCVGAFQAFRELIYSLWPAASGADPHGGAANVAGKHFRADALLWHPMLLGHAHVADRLGIPFQCASLDPLSPTFEFPHVLSSIPGLETVAMAPQKSNLLTYDVADAILCHGGVSDVLNQFRAFIGLTNCFNKTDSLAKWEVPHMYLYNPALLRKPVDWGAELTVTGHVTTLQHDNESRCLPRALTYFAVALSDVPVIYFGLSTRIMASGEVEDMLRKVDITAQQLQIRVIVQILTGDSAACSPTGSDWIYHAESDIPYAQIFPYVAATIHWGEADVLAEGLKSGKPVAVCGFHPFQLFTARMSERSGVGIPLINPAICTVKSLTRSFQQLLQPGIRQNAQALARTFDPEQALNAAVQAFYSNLPLPAMRCDVNPSKIARVFDSRHGLKLSLEAYLAVEPVRDTNKGFVLYKPLLYGGGRPPTYSIRGIPGEILHDVRPAREIDAIEMALDVLEAQDDSCSSYMSQSFTTRSSPGSFSRHMNTELYWTSRKEEERPFTVSVNVEESSFSIVNSAGDQVWKSAPDRPLISASTGLTTITQASGNFQLSSEDVGIPCQTATISDWTWTLSFTLDVSSEDDSQPLVFNASVAGTDVDNVYLSYESPQNEAFFGLGEQTGIGNLRGWRVPVWTREGGVGRGEEPVTTYLNENASISGVFAGGSLLTTYTGVGSLTTSLGRWIILDSTKYALFDLASNATSPFEDTAAGYLAGNITEGDYANGSTTTVQVMYEGTSMSGWIGRAAQGNPLLEATGALTKVTGQQPKLPDWAHDGAILGIQGGQDFVEEVVQNAISANMPLVSVWLQDWSGTRLQTGAYGISLHRLWWNWEPDTTLYPTWAEWVPHLQSTYGVRTMSYINTFLANVSSKSTGYNTSFYEIAATEGRFVANATADDGSAWTITSGPGIDAGLLDLSNQSTIDWFKALVKKQYYSVPISGMMQDFGEYLSVDDSVSLSSGTISPRVFHNDYPTVWAALLRDVATELGVENDTIGFHRSAGTFSAKHTNLFWVGDQNIDESREDGMRAVISSTLHVGASGFAQTHSDIGGYTNTLAAVGNITRSAPLLGRWGELGAFSGTAFRTHEGNIPQVNVQAYTDAETRAYHAYNARMFRSLKPYRLALLDEYQSNGWPIVRHPMVYSPNDSVACAVIDDTFWLGEALYVAPVYDLSASSVEVYLPPIQVDSKGTAVNESSYTYRHVWSGDEYAPGQTVTVDAPWGKPGVFMRWPVTEQEGLQLQQLWEFVIAENTTVLAA